MKIEKLKNGILVGGYNPLTYTYTGRDNIYTCSSVEQRVCFSMKL